MTDEDSVQNWHKIGVYGHNLLVTCCEREQFPLLKTAVLHPFLGCFLLGIDCFLLSVYGTAVDCLIGASGIQVRKRVPISS